MSFFEKKRQEAIVVFAYDFPHRKTCEFIKELYFSGFLNLIVIAAPKIKLKVDQAIFFDAYAFGVAPEEISQICGRLGIKLYKCSHDDCLQIRSIVSEHNAKFAIIAGARIIAKEILDLFHKGVLNFHPGKIPETSGLDALYYSMSKGVCAGVTAHLIDQRVDAGMLWKFSPVNMSLNDSIGVVAEKIFWKQIALLRQFLTDALNSDLEFSKIDRPSKNRPMTSLEKYTAMQQCSSWIIAHAWGQMRDRIYSACTTNEIFVIQREVGSGFPINEPIRGDWTALVVASFNHSLDIVRWLLKNGANANYCNHRGTSVLMYAKTKYLHVNRSDYPILDLLIEAGARPCLKDNYGKTVVDYCADSGDYKLVEYFNAAMIKCE